MNNDNLGCLGTGIAILLAMLFLAGNVAMFTGDTDEMGFAIVVAAIADLALVIWGISAFGKHMEQKAEQKEAAEESYAKKQFDELYNYYNINKISMPLSTHHDFKHGNIEIIECVNKYKENNADTIKELNIIRKNISAILNCPSCNTSKDKLAYIETHKEELDKLHEQSEKYFAIYNSYKIKLLQEKSNTINELKKAFNLVRKSKKITTESDVTLDALFSYNKTPHDLSMFSYDFEPFTICYKHYIFCLFEKVILVFKEKGDFYTALDPSDLHIKVNHFETDITVRNNSYTSDIIADDSEHIKTVSNYTTWLHTCRDGSPDLRYSYNPRIEYSTVRMGYGTLSFEIMGLKVEYTISSSTAVKQLDIAQQHYCKSYKNYHNPIPGFLNLLNMVTNSEPKAKELREKYNENVNEENYFCQLVKVGSNIQ